MQFNYCRVQFRDIAAFSFKMIGTVFRAQTYRRTKQLSIGVCVQLLPKLLAMLLTASSSFLPALFHTVVNILAAQADCLHQTPWKTLCWYVQFIFRKCEFHILENSTGEIAWKHKYLPILSFLFSILFQACKWLKSTFPYCVGTLRLFTQP